MHFHFFHATKSHPISDGFAVRHGRRNIRLQDVQPSEKKYMIVIHRRKRKRNSPPDHWNEPRSIQRSCTRGGAAAAARRGRRSSAVAMAETEAGSCSYDVLTACFILVAQSRPRNTNRTAPRHPRGGRQIRIPSTRSVNQIPSAPGRGRPNATRRRAVSWRRKASRRKPPA